MHGTVGFMCICFPVPQVFRASVRAAYSVGLCHSKKPSKFVRGLLTNLSNPCFQEDSILLSRSTRRETPWERSSGIDPDTRCGEIPWRLPLNNVHLLFLYHLGLESIPISLHQPLWLIWLGPDLCSLYNSIKAAISRTLNSRMKPACNIDLSWSSLDKQYKPWISIPFI